MTQKIFVIFIISFIANTTHSMDINSLLNPVSAISPQEIISLSYEPQTQQRTSVSDKKKFTCDLCPEKFSSKISLHYHKKSMHEKHLHFCNVDNCKEYFTYPLAAKNHRKKMHPDVTKHICHYFECPAQFNSAPDLQSHTQQVHTKKTHTLKERITCYKCHLCHNEFRRKQHLVDHIYVKHQGNLFWCNFGDCNKSFAARSSVKSHRKIHDIPFPVCFFEACFFKGCQQSFETPQKLTDHIMNKHTSLKFICPHETCKQTFPTNDNLTNHIIDTHAMEAEIVSPQEHIQ